MGARRSPVGVLVARLAAGLVVCLAALAGFAKVTDDVLEADHLARVDIGVARWVIA